MPDQTIKLNNTQIAAFVVLFLATVAQLHSQGRRWWCACGQSSLWASDIRSSHNSQHLIDAYSFTHLMHGVLFCFIGWMLLPRLAVTWKLWLGTAAECCWEILENSDFIIHRYREGTISLGYEGDSMINSLGDVGCCVAGMLLARWLGLGRSITVFIATELALLLTIRDNLTLNILMLIHPIEVIKTWQMAG